MNYLILHTNQEGSVSSICIAGSEDYNRVQEYVIKNNLKNTIIVSDDSLPERSLEYCKIVDGQVITDEEYKENKAFDLMRRERTRLLQQTDWTQNRDVTLANDAEWAAYRQALRDLPNTATPELDEYGNLTNVTWPEKPE